MNFLKCAILILVCLISFSANKAFTYVNDSYIDTFESQFEKVVDDKYYVKPGTVLVSSGEIFLSYHGQLVPVVSIECDEEGVFLYSTAFKWGRCPACGYPLVWGVCLNSDCPSKR